jgi:hypothetical protein
MSVPNKSQQFLREEVSNVQLNYDHELFSLQQSAEKHRMILWAHCTLADVSFAVVS